MGVDVEAVLRGIPGWEEARIEALPGEVEHSLRAVQCVDGQLGATVRLIAEYVTRDDPPHLLSGFDPAGRPPRRHLFQTFHRQGDGPQRIRLLHLFLPFPPRGAVGGS